MDSDVLSFVRLAVDCEGEIGGMHWRYPDNSWERILIEYGQH